MNCYLVLALLLVCSAVRTVRSGTMMKDWGHDDWGAKEGAVKEWEQHMGDWEEQSWDDEADKMKDFLKECVKGGKLSKEDAKKILKSLQWGSDNGMKDKWGMDWDDDSEWKDDWTDDGKQEHEAWAEEWMDEEHDGMKKDYKKTIKLLGHLFKDARSSDPLIDVDHKNTMHIYGEWSSQPKHAFLCQTRYTLPEVHVKTMFNGDVFPASVTRDPPVLYIVDHNGEKVHEGLYTFLGVGRGTLDPAVGSFEHPLILSMITNIPGSDVDKGDFIVPYIGEGFNDFVQGFLYEQNDRIDDDFAIAQYTNWNECKFRFRCQFQQADFVAAYSLHLRWVGHFSIVPDLYSPHFFKDVIYQISGREACMYYLESVIPSVFKLFHVNVHDEAELKHAFKKFTSQYITKETLSDKSTKGSLTRQLNALKVIFLYKFPHDELVPVFADLDETVSFHYMAAPNTVKMCGLKFDLPAVEREVHFKDCWDEDRVELLSSEIREAPHVEIMNIDKHSSRSGQLFTLMIVDRTPAANYSASLGAADRSYLGDTDTPYLGDTDTPFINYMVMNIRDRHIETGDVVVPYHAWPASTGQFVFLYEQPTEFIDMPMDQYANNDNECWVENRCITSLKDLQYDYNLRLAFVARYDIKRDMYGETYMSRWGRLSRDEECANYLGRHSKAPKGGYE